VPCMPTMTTSNASSPRPGATLEKDASPELAFPNDYSLEEKLRSGSYGVVWTTRHNVSNEEYAVKVIDRTKLKKKKDDDGVIREVSILKDLLDCENIVRLIDFYEEPETFYIVQVYAKGGDVFDRLAKRTSYTEKDARDLSMKLLQTMQILHERKLVHRDLKPENLLLKDAFDDSSILLADFGFATYVPEDGLKTRCGTPAFVAPEILLGNRYNELVDMWSVGCLIFMLIGGYPPFQDESQAGLFRKIRGGDFTFHDCYWTNVSIHAKQLISKLLTVDPAFRLNAQDSMNTAWLQMGVAALSSSDLSVSIGELQKFNARRTLKSAMHTVLWTVAGAGAAFRQDKVSDLTKATDNTDEENSKFSMSKPHKSKFEDLYEMGEKVHRGSFAIVNECLHKEWREKYAVKIIKRDGSNDYAVLHEVAIMNQLDHEHIVKVIDFFEEPDYYFIVMELMGGGDVFDRIVEKDQYSEKDARDLAKLLLEAVNYMHSNGVAHRDLKPQNLLLEASPRRVSCCVGSAITNSLLRTCCCVGFANTHMFFFLPLLQ
jgi:serine/threonine protein kinase